jgi:hypothetical protein
MGYTHYYDVSAEFDEISFGKISADFKKIIPPLKHLGVILADGAGENHPTISPTEICFNGLTKCGHEERELGITWPAKSASGINPNKVGQQLQELVSGKWFAGAELSTRVCGGDCSHETFSLEQKLQTTITRYDGSTYQDEPRKKYEGYTNSDGTKKITPENQIGKYFQCTKTTFKPYDLAVTVCLVIAKQYFGENIVIRSDGSMENWHEAMNLCHHFLGYGRGFCLDDEKSVPLDNTDSSAMVSQCDKNEKEITSLKETQENMEKEKREQINEIATRYNETIYELDKQKHIETDKLEDDIDYAEKETHQKIEKLSEAKTTLNRVLYFLKIQNKKLDSTPLDKIKNYRDRYLEIAEKWNDENMELHLFIAENDRPKNKYSVIVVGNSKIGSSDRNDTILVLPHSYGVDIDAWNLDILSDVKHFPSINDAKKYLKTHNIQSILKEFFVQYDIVKSEYDSVISKYTLKDFEDILRVRLSKYFEGGVYSESKMIQAAKKLGVNTITVSEMSFAQVSLLAERYL